MICITCLPSSIASIVCPRFPRFIAEETGPLKGRTLHEIRRALRRLGTTRDKLIPSISAAFDELDADGNGVVDIDEFVTAMKRLKV